MDIKRIEAEVNAMIKQITSDIEVFDLSDCEQYSKVSLNRYLNAEIDKLELDATLRQINIRVLNSELVRGAIDINRMQALHAMNDAISERIAAGNINLNRFHGVSA
jgi:hypothetical protein